MQFLVLQVYVFQVQVLRKFCFLLKRPCLLASSGRLTDEDLGQVLDSGGICRPHFGDGPGRTEKRLQMYPYLTGSNSWVLGLAFREDAL